MTSQSACSRWVCNASAVTTVRARSRPHSSGRNAVISLVLPATSTWPRTARVVWSTSAGRPTGRAAGGPWPHRAGGPVRSAGPPRCPARPVPAVGRPLPTHQSPPRTWPRPAPHTATARMLASRGRRPRRSQGSGSAATQASRPAHRSGGTAPWRGWWVARRDTEEDRNAGTVFPHDRWLQHPHDHGSRACLVSRSPHSAHLNQARPVRTFHY